MSWLRSLKVLWRKLRHPVAVRSSTKVINKTVQQGQVKHLLTGKRSRRVRVASLKLSPRSPSRRRANIASQTPPCLLHCSLLFVLCHDEKLGVWPTTQLQKNLLASKDRLLCASSSKRRRRLLNSKAVNLFTLVPTCSAPNCNTPRGANARGRGGVHRFLNT